MVYTYMILKTSTAMTYYHFPIPKKLKRKLPNDGLVLDSSYLWLVIEQLVFIGTLLSCMVFIAIRSCIRSKLVLDRMDVKKQLPNVDTIIATQETVNAFNA